MLTDLWNKVKELFQSCVRRKAPLNPNRTHNTHNNFILPQHEVQPKVIPSRTRRKSPTSHSCPSLTSYRIPKYKSPCADTEAMETQAFIASQQEVRQNLQQIEKMLNRLCRVKGESNPSMRENKPPRIIIHDNMHDYEQLMSVVEYKYSGERVDFPTFTPEQYSMVIAAWKSLPKNKVVSLKAPNRSLDILYKDIQTLGAGNWLNDQIINKYISMINDQLSKSNSVYRVLHSQFFSVLSKGEKKILAGLEKQRINTHNIIIAVIHTGNHWLFIKICTGTITVYDSLASSQPEYYLNNSMVRRYRDMANWYYGVQHKIVVCEDYPRQTNHYDCGVFMLCGIKDVVRSYFDWSFNRTECKYKRFLICLEVMQERLFGF